jgi:hypothetical protein
VEYYIRFMETGNEQKWWAFEFGLLPLPALRRHEVFQRSRLCGGRERVSEREFVDETKAVMQVSL